MFLSAKPGWCVAKALSPLASPGRPAVEEEIMAAKTTPRGDSYCALYTAYCMFFPFCAVIHFNHRNQWQKPLLVGTHIVLCILHTVYRFVQWYTLTTENKLTLVKTHIVLQP